ncbi:unnamed protein product [Albugo candida]|nr:unnamed protein product [Albugo candida]|eukprot:CCI41473.1 unnamed protein product [Albugo candida]
MSWMESTQCASVLNLHDDVILPYCRDAENARTVLININEALAIIESRHFGGGRIRILISHQNGYFGRDFDFFNAKITRFIRLEKEEDVALTENLVKKFDSFCEKYQTECQVATQVRRPSTTLGLDLNVHVNAQYNVWMDPSRLEQESEFGTDWMQGHMFKLNFVWNGLENTRAFLCPPIESSEAHTSFSVQLRQATSDDPHPNVASTSSPEYQPCHWERDLYLLRALGKTLANPKHRTKEHDDGMCSEERRVGIINDFRELLVKSVSTHSVGPLVAPDSENGMSSDSPVLKRCNFDLLEKIWVFFASSGASVRLVIELMQETFRWLSSIRSMPLLHATNQTALASYVRLQLEYTRAKSNGNAQQAAEHAAQLKTLQSLNEALEALSEFGRWKIGRDIAHYLSKLGILSESVTTAIQNLMVDGDVRLHPRDVITIILVVRFLSSAGVTHDKCRGYVESICILLEQQRSEFRKDRWTSKRICVKWPVSAAIIMRSESVRRLLPDLATWDLQLTNDTAIQRHVRLCRQSIESWHPTWKTMRFESETTLRLDASTLQRLRRVPIHIASIPAIHSFLRDTASKASAIESVDYQCYVCTIEAIQYGE